ncbi:hypothetical protein PC116_g15696 [Phytophthora cactorum]|nr:hypothetical protein PC120_g13656 [Phytophthora cactorum]KAG3074029.1 hypothetical protein PC121_g8443 [Phytophthora cactorum]KAG3175786.1 hypothetical protein C6341_g9289 [Phytophthora cactorum]KAG3194961.1 hypothetical protein PC128_g8886 [Phytophthora cactorum]KAG4050355.1 hypothetical protein PC123_g14404 [Phytophthora cactorum]
MLEATWPDFVEGLRTVATRPRGGRKAAFDVASIARSRFSTELCAQLRPPSRRTEILPVERSPDRKRSNLRWGRGLQGGCMSPITLHFSKSDRPVGC